MPRRINSIEHALVVVAVIANLDGVARDFPAHVEVIVDDLSRHHEGRGDLVSLE
jgi:hypothetical protein